MRSATRVLLLYPEIPANTYWSFSGALPFVGKRAAMPPLGLATVAAMLPEHWSVRLIDANVSAVTDRDLQWAELVFLSAMIIQAPSFAQLAQRARAHGCITVAGGPYPSQHYEAIGDAVDHLVLGEAESGVLAAFLADLAQGAPRRVYARLALRHDRAGSSIDQAELVRLRQFAGDNADICVVPSRPPMSASPLPRFDLLQIGQYGSMAIQLSRGCPYNCEFCNEPALFGHQPRLKRPEQINLELQSLYDLGYRGPIFFVDDNFIGNIGQVATVLKHIQTFQQQRHYPFSFYTEASINLAHNHALMTAMTQAGFSMVFVGIETTDTAALQAANKVQNMQADLLDDVRTIQRHGMEVTAGFIVGMDAEASDTCEQIFTFAQQAGIPTVMVSLLTPLRGSTLYERLQREQRLVQCKLAGNNTHSFDLGYLPDRGRDPAAIVNDYKQLLQRLYDRSGRNYFARCRKLLQEIGDSPTFVRSVGKTELLAVTRSVRDQCRKSYSLTYCWFLMTCLIRHHRKLPEAVRLAITGHHLLEITRYALETETVKQELGQRLERLRQAAAAYAAHGETELLERARCARAEAYKTWQKARKTMRHLPEIYQGDLQTICAECENQLNRACDNLIGNQQQHC